MKTPTNRMPVMNKSEREEFIEQLNEESTLPMVLLDGFEDCLLYYMTDESGNNHAVYCYEDMVETFAKTNHTTYLEAVEFVDNNTMRAIQYMGNGKGGRHAAPVVIYRLNRDFTTLDNSYFKNDYSDEKDKITKE